MTHYPKKNWATKNWAKKNWLVWSLCLLAVSVAGWSWLATAAKAERRSQDARPRCVFQP